MTELVHLLKDSSRPITRCGLTIDGNALGKAYAAGYSEVVLEPVCEPCKALAILETKEPTVTSAQDQADEIAQLRQRIIGLNEWQAEALSVMSAQRELINKLEASLAEAMAILKPEELTQ